MGFLDRFRTREPTETRPCVVCNEPRPLTDYLDTPERGVTIDRPLADLCARCRVTCTRCKQPRDPADFTKCDEDRRRHLSGRYVASRFATRLGPAEISYQAAARDPHGLVAVPPVCDPCFYKRRCYVCGEHFAAGGDSHIGPFATQRDLGPTEPSRCLTCREPLTAYGLVPITAADLADLTRIAGDTTTTATTETVTLGTNEVNQPVTLDRATRNKHLYLIGKSRTGKTTLMLNLMRDDLAAGDGLTFIDPAGDAAHQLLGYVPASRADQVTYFDPTRDDCPALNLLALPYDRDKLAGEIVSAFRLFFDSWGPRMGMLLRNGLLALLDDRTHEPHSIADLERLYIDEDYRDTIAKRAADPRLIRFLNDDLPRFERSALDPVLNKLDAFLSTHLLARLFGATTNALDFDALLNSRQVLVCSLSKGKIGEEPAKFLGGLIVAALTMAALARADQPPAARADHFLYVDEFQNFAVSSFATIFAEAAKYRLNLTVAHQTRDQLTPEIRAALGNASTYIVFRISYGDAANLSPELATRTTKPTHETSRPQLVQLARAVARTILDSVQTFPTDFPEDPKRPALADFPPTPCIRWHHAAIIPTLKRVANDPDDAARRHGTFRELAGYLRDDQVPFPELAHLLTTHASNLLYPAPQRRREPWPAAGDIVNLENLHAFARIERPENTTALTVPFPPAEDENTEHARAAVLATQAEKNRRAQKPQEPRTPPETTEPLHQNSTTFDDDAGEAVHSPHATEATPEPETKRPTRRLPAPRRRA